MDQNWLMAALQSPEGMNFLNSWRQRYGAGGATGGINQGPYGRWRIPGTGGPNQGTYTGSMPGTGGNTSIGGAFHGTLPSVQEQPQSLSIGSPMQHMQPQPPQQSFSIGGNDLAGRQQPSASPMMPYWSQGN